MNAKANIKEHTLRVLFYVALLMGLCSIPIFVFTKTVISAVVPPFGEKARFTVPLFANGQFVNCPYFPSVKTCGFDSSPCQGSLLRSIPHLAENGAHIMKFLFWSIYSVGVMPARSLKRRQK